jgi:hypothetical protein
LTEISTENFLGDAVVSNNDREDDNSAQIKRNDGLDLAYDKKVVGKPSRQMN